MPPTDRELVRQTLAGDLDAFGALMKKYQGLLYSLAYHRLQNFTDAQDVVQETFIKAFRKLPQLQDPDRFPAWL